MRHTSGVGVDCTDCGLTTGHFESTGHARCGDCGRFAETSNDYCAQHNVNVRRLPNGYTSCPKCRERDRIEAMEQEMHARRADPRMHSSVDAPRF